MQVLSPAVRYRVNSAKLSCDTASLYQVIDSMRTALHDASYSSVYASIHCPFDMTMQQRIQERVGEVGIVDTVVVIGIGGSSLGFRAVYDALQDQARLGPHAVHILETVDAAAVCAALHTLEQMFAQQLCVHVCVVSKSGTTIETIALWSVLQSLLQRYYPVDWTKKVTIITDAKSPLEQYAHEQMITMFTIPTLVGGRYSVFSAAGLFPLALCGISLNDLVLGAQDAVTESLVNSTQNSMSIQHATALVAAYQQGYQVHDTFIFSTWCAAIGAWYRQLSAESLGKANTRDQNVVSMIPTVSIGSTDLHSIGQLYLSGANNFWTTFIFVNEQSTVYTTSGDSLNACVPLLKNLSINTIMAAIQEGTLKAYQECNVPVSVVMLTNRSPYTIGYLLQSYMLAIMYAGVLLDVNPFDQPDVKRYKQSTRELLAKADQFFRLEVFLYAIDNIGVGAGDQIFLSMFIF